MIQQILLGGAGPLTASVSPTSLSGQTVLLGGPSSYYVTTAGSATVTASGGTGTYTFTWERVSGSSAIHAVNGFAATTAFSGEVPLNTTITAVLRCKVSDGVTETYTPNVNVSLYYGTQIT